MEQAEAPPSDPTAAKPSRRPAFRAAGSLAAVGVVLAIAFFPTFFDKWAGYDDEGVFLGGLRALLAHHGHLYSTIWSDFYGPFYYGAMSTVYRVLHQQPSLDNSRWILLVLTVASAALIGGAVWRVVKNVPCSIVAEVAAFVMLVPGAGYEPAHPGALEAFLVALIAFELASFVDTRRAAHLAAIGVATGALTMTKVNAGALVAIALVFAFVVGNPRFPRWLHMVIGSLAALVPIVVVFQHIDNTSAATFAVLVLGSITAMVVIMSIDPLPLPRLSLVSVACGALVAVLCSLAFPLFSGTTVADEFRGVFVRPLTFADKFAILPVVGLDWLAFVITMVGVGAAVAFTTFSKEKVTGQRTWVYAALAAVALWVLGLGIEGNPMGHTLGQATATWLPIIVVLPALALCGRASEPVRLALRLLVSYAVLQVLVSYPVAGPQVAWGTLPMIVPCGIALAVGVDHSRTWRTLGRLLRGGATLMVCLALIIIAGTWPTTAWKSYADNAPLGLPGTALIRVDPATTASLRGVTKELRAHCDTFYGVPNLGTFYIFSGLRPLTGMVANGSPAGLTADQQEQIADALQRKLRSGERVCILRSHVLPTPEPTGELGHTLKKFSTVVATVGPYTISRHRFATPRSSQSG